MGNSIVSFNLEQWKQDFRAKTYQDIIDDRIETAATIREIESDVLEGRLSRAQADEFIEREKKRQIEFEETLLEDLEDALLM